MTNKKHVRRNYILFLFLVLKTPDISKLLSSYGRFYRPDFVYFRSNNLYYKTDIFFSSY